MADQRTPSTPKRDLTDADKQAYIDKGAGHCLFCGDHSIDGSSFDFDGTSVWQEVTCHACGAVWQDVYELKYVQVVELPEKPKEGAPA